MRYALCVSYLACNPVRGEVAGLRPIPDDPPFNPQASSIRTRWDAGIKHLMDHPQVSQEVKGKRKGMGKGDQENQGGGKTTAD